ncbi:unnamed protein product [Choristocarpus tenellus]
MVLVPSIDIFNMMQERFSTLPTYDGGDTGFLNAFFNDWFTRPASSRLPFRYNALRSMYWITHGKNPGYWEAIRPLKILHYCSSPKPWEETNRKGDLEMLWWTKYVALKVGGGC